jgi:hypothetical protein
MQSFSGPLGTRMADGFVDDFLRLVDEATARMLAIEDQDAGRPRAEGKWSRKEIVGHLIDSAINNHARFVRGALQPDFVFEGYDQDAWVRAQRYQDRNWAGLVRAWRVYNRQIAEVVRATPAEALERPRPRHNLHEIAFCRLPAEAVATLQYLVEDYVAHLQHHLRQVLDAETPREAALASVGLEH